MADGTENLRFDWPMLGSEAPVAVTAVVLGGAAPWPLRRYRDTVSRLMPNSTASSVMVLPASYPAAKASTSADFKGREVRGFGRGILPAEWAFSVWERLRAPDVQVSESLKDRLRVRELSRQVHSTFSAGRLRSRQETKIEP